MSSGALDHLVRTNALTLAHRGVYVDPAAPPTREQRLLAAVLAMGSTAYVSHRSAAAVWGVPNVRCDLVELTKPSHAASLTGGVLVHRTRRLPAEERAEHRGLPITTPARTTIDLAAVVGPAMVSRAIEHWLASGRMSLPSLRAALRRNAHRPGRDAVETILASRIAGDVQADSPAEGLLGHVLLRAGLHGLVHHHLVTVPSGHTYELDWSFPAGRLGLEMDGYGVHLRSLEQFERDRVRRNELEIHGWQILDFTRRQLERRPERIVDQVQRALDARIASASPRLEG